MKESLIIDTDPGIDDAVALATGFAAPNIDIKLLCSTAGNLGIETTTRNVLHLCELFNQNIPVAKGEDGPLKRKLVTAQGKHGKMGFGSYTYGKVTKKALPIPAYEAMHYALQLYPNSKVLVMGPLTNLAKLILEYPQDVKKIKEIIFMGGTKDNVFRQDKPYPEFNITRDPEACEIVLNCGAKVTIIPMDFGHEAYISAEEIKIIKKTNLTGKFFAKLYEEYKDGHVKQPNAATHDSCAMAYVIEPTIFKLEKVKAGIKFYDDKGILFANIVKNSKIQLAVDMDHSAFKNLYFGLLGVSKINHVKN